MKRNIEENVNKSKRKRIRKKARNTKRFSLKILGNNVDGLSNKLESLEHIIVTEDPSLIFLQETKLGRSGRIKTANSTKYTWYEHHRSTNEEKGVKGKGLAIEVLTT